jgi:hypothetical protein
MEVANAHFLFTPKWALEAARLRSLLNRRDQFDVLIQNRAQIGSLGDIVVFDCRTSCAGHIGILRQAPFQPGTK